MADYLKSAFNYLTSSPLVKNENELIGSTFHVDSLSIRIKRVIAEGGYGVVYEAQDNTKGSVYALKRMLSHDKGTTDLILREIQILKQLSGHPNIMQFVGATCVSKDKQKGVGTEFVIVTELCRGGQLSEYLPAPHQERPLPPATIIQIMHQTCRAVEHMHNQSPPVMHRDLKIENLLLSNNFIIKLCDFGSASTVAYNPDLSWTALRRGTVQEELEKFTTPMYRAPEMLDLYQNYPIGPPSDVWALGCILFYLTCTYHPFEESAKLAILNAKYNLPAGTSEHSVFHGLIRQMLLLDPRQRPTVTVVLSELSELASMREIRVSGPISWLAEANKRRTGMSPGPNKPMPPTQSAPIPHSHHPINGSKTDISDIPVRSVPTASPDRPGHPPTAPSKPTTPARPTQPPVPLTHPPAGSIFANAHATSTDVSRSDAAIPTPGSGSGSMLGMLKGSAGSLFRNLRDASSKVIEQVSASLATDLDFQLITSRIAVMSYPGESGIETLGSGNSIEEVQAMLNARYPDSYAVYNLSARTYRSERWFDGRVSHRVFEPNRAPALRSLMELCLNARLWLSQKPKNICVIHCTDGRALSAILVCSLLCFCRLFDNVSPALQLFSSKRGNPHLSPSQTRYIEYVAQLAHGRIATPHQRPLKLIKLTMAPVPTFNKSKNGCRPYVEVYEGKTRLLSSFTDYETLKSYVLEDGKIELLLNGISVMGDLTVVVYHCRSSFAGRNKIASVKIAQFQLYTGFLEPQQTELIYFKSDLDCLDSNSGFGGFTSRYAESFHITLEFMVSPKERPRQGNNLVYPWEMMPGPDALRPDLCISSDQELHALMSDFGRFNINRNASKRSPPARPKSTNRPIPSTTGTSASPKPDADSSHSFTGDHLPGGGIHETKVGEHAQPSERRHDNDSPRTSVPSKPEKVTPDIWSTDGVKSTDVSHPEDSTPVADLLGFHSANSDPAVVHSSPSFPPAPPPILDPTDNTQTVPNVLIDVDLGPTPPEPLSHAVPDVSALVDDFFNVSTGVTSGPSDKIPADVNWATAFDIPSTAPPTSSNPFDIFSETTTGSNPIVDEFTAPSTQPVPPTSTIDPSSDATPHPERFTAWWNNGGPGHMSSSASATNLNAGHAGNPLFASASCTNLTPPPADAGPKSATAADPFADLSNVFNRSSDPNRVRPAAGATTAAGGFSAGPSPIHRPGSTAPGSAPTAAQGARPHVGKDAFSDLLNDFGESTSWQANTDGQGQSKSINQMRREQLAKTTDPDQLKVQDWAQGKSRNVRALLCSLPAVLWEGVRWKPVSITDLINADQVKRQYRNAARAIHPDKWRNTEHEKLARMIFIELNDAMTEFEKDPGSALSF